MKRPPKAPQEAQKNNSNCTERTGHIFWKIRKIIQKKTKNGLINKGRRFAPPFCRPFFVILPSFFKCSQKMCDVRFVQVAISGMRRQRRRSAATELCALWRVLPNTNNTAVDWSSYGHRKSSRYDSLQYPPGFTKLHAYKA